MACWFRCLIEYLLLVMFQFGIRFGDRSLYGMREHGKASQKQTFTTTSSILDSDNLLNRH